MVTSGSRANRKMPDAERLEMCRQALAVAERDEERELAARSF